MDQVTLLTQDIEGSFQANEKAGVVLLDLTGAYDTVWLRGLHLKLLRTIPDRHMVKFLMEMLSNHSFIHRTSDGQQSRLRRLRNGVPQGSPGAQTIPQILWCSAGQDLEDVRAKVLGSLRQDTTDLHTSPCVPPRRSPHVKKVDSVINNALRIVTGCLKPTLCPVCQSLQVMPRLLARKAQEHTWHILHEATTKAVRLRQTEVASPLQPDCTRAAWFHPQGHIYKSASRHP